MKTYTVKEIFFTVQGEGVHAGRASIFVRFAGCNMWTGDPDKRERDKNRSDVSCSLWCDTDFQGGEKYTAQELSKAVWSVVPNKWKEHIIDQRYKRWENSSPDDKLLIVFTGGEPLLQLDAELCKALQLMGDYDYCVETNGTIALDKELEGWLFWICCSPKVRSEKIKLEYVDELKVPHPSVIDPLSYKVKARRRSVLPIWKEGEEQPQTSACLEFIAKNPSWVLCSQTHKLVGVR